MMGEKYREHERDVAMRLDGDTRIVVRSWTVLLSMSTSAIWIEMIIFQPGYSVCARSFIIHGHRGKVEESLKCLSESGS